MKTVKATGPLLYAVKTEGHGAPAGKVIVQCVRYETYEVDAKDFDKMVFNVHDSASEEAQTLAKVINS